MRVKKYVPYAMIAIGFGLIITGVVVAFTQQKQNEKIIKIASADGITLPTTKKISESEFQKYTVAASLPRYIFIPSINVKAIVQSVGLTKNNQIDTPNSIYNTGWFNQSSKPGQAGATVIDGHFGTWQTKGIFSGISGLKAGTIIQIQKGDGTKLNYSVVSVKTYPLANVDMNALLNPVNTKTSGLNLITCSGTVVKGTYQYDKRVIVFAQLVK